MEEVGDATLGEAGMASKLLVGGREAVFGEGAGDTDSSGAVAQKGGEVMGEGVADGGTEAACKLGVEGDGHGEELGEVR